jgi:hypothetical protein
MYLNKVPNVLQTHPYVFLYIYILKTWTSYELEFIGHMTKTKVGLCVKITFIVMKNL